MKTATKYTVRRLVASTLFAPVLVGAYWIVWVVLVAGGASGNYASFERNAWTLAIVFVAVSTFYPQISRAVTKLVEGDD